MVIIHKIASWYILRRLEKIQRFSDHPIETQKRVHQSLMEKGKHTQWGQDHNYKAFDRLDQFQEAVPISTYEELFPYIERTLNGEENVLWPGRTTWFAKSSGTTNDKSKFIPMSEESMDHCHFEAGRDLLAAYFNNREDSRLFSGRVLSLSGSHDINHQNGKSHYGDLSAVLLENLPFFYSLVRIPSKRVALMAEWEGKIAAMAEEIVQTDMTGFAGVPTWAMVLFNHIFDKRGTPQSERNLLDIWPNLECFAHGGVNFAPYRPQFEALIPSKRMAYQNCYNASEGFFGFQDNLEVDDLLLLLDYGIFYEFIPMDQMNEDHPKTLTLEEVELDTVYAMVISTNGGLWRYMLGDTVEFTSLYPFKIRVAGRTKHFINAFGEELMVGNAEAALAHACELTGAIISDYTAAPVFFDGASQGRHEWLIEFDRPPANLEEFVYHLDEHLQHLNSDYEAKRYQGMALQIPLVHAMPQGTFYQWMKKRGKLGGQNKVPRLANERKYVEDILQMVAGKA
ncbi:MAG: GH3 auxin-responsive promoter family protein [Bacteroidota bacterium]